MGVAPASAREQCERCGSFVAGEQLDRHRVCDDCVSRLSELERIPASVSSVVIGALGVLARLALPALVLVVAASLPVYLLRRSGWEIPIVGWALDVLVQGVLLVMAHRVVQARRVGLVECASVASDHVGRLLVVALLAHLQVILIYAAVNLLGLFGMIAVSGSAVALWLVLGAAQVVGLGLALWRASSLALALPIALHEDSGGLAALALSARRVREHRGPAFVFAVVGFAWLLIPLAHSATMIMLDMTWGLAGVLNPSVGDQLGTQIALITPVLEVGTLVLSALALLLMTSVSAVLYAKTVKYRVY